MTKQIKHHRFMRDRKFKKRGSSYEAGTIKEIRKNVKKINDTEMADISIKKNSISYWDYAGQIGKTVIEAKKHNSKYAMGTVYIEYDDPEEGEIKLEVKKTREDVLKDINDISSEHAKVFPELLGD